MSPGTRRSVVLVASLTLATTAIGGPALAQNPSGDAPATTVNLFNSTYPDRLKPAKKKGGQVIFADWQEAHIFNPYYYNEVTEANVATTTQAGLITSTDDYKYAPDLAVSIPTTDNGGVVVNADKSMTVTWQLRDGLMWSDGQPLTCDDFAFTVDWIIDPQNVGMPAGKSGYLTDDYLARFNAWSQLPENLDGDPANDTTPPPVTEADKFLHVTCNSPTDMVWQLAALYLPYPTLIPFPLPRHYLGSIPILDARTGKGYLAAELPNAPVSGPFKFESVTPGQDLRVVRNENYKDHITGEPAYLERIIFKWYGTADAMIAAYSGGEPEFDLATDLNDGDLPKLTGLNAVVAIPSLTYELLRPNWSAAHCSLTLQSIRGGACTMADPAMREALKFAIDKNAINLRLLGGVAVMAYTSVAPNAYFYVAPTVIPTQDLDHARQVLLDAGWVEDPANPPFLFKDTDGDGVKDYSKGDYDARVEACTSTRQLRQDTLAMVSGFMNSIGVQVLISPVGSGDFFAAYNGSTPQTPCNLSHGNFDLAEHAFSVPLDPTSNYPVYHSSQFEPNGQNDGQVSDPAIDEALTNVKNTVDFSVVLANMATFQQIYQDKTIEVPLYFRQEVYLKNPKIVNFTGNPTSTGPLWNAQHWWKKGGK
jgi:peptide/nickel transport system substrate-binding protein